MQLTHSAWDLDQGSCSINVTVVSLGTLSWGSWEPLKVFEQECDKVRAVLAGRLDPRGSGSQAPPALFLPSGLRRSLFSG